MNDAWKLAKEIWCTYSGGYLEEIFGTMEADEVMDNFTPQEALAKVKEYEEKQKEIEVGDVLLSKLGDVCVVTRIYDNREFYGMFKDGSCSRLYKEDFRKTAKTLDIQKVIDGLKG